MGYRLLATLVLALHFGYLAYLVLGGFLAWRWPRTIWLHLAAAGWGATIVVADRFADGITCPLTYAEDWARRRAGDAPLTTGFIDRYLEGVVYPERYAAVAQAVAAAAVLVSWIGYAMRWRRRRARLATLRPSLPLLAQEGGPAVHRSVGNGRSGRRG